MTWKRSPCPYCGMDRDEGEPGASSVDWTCFHCMTRWMGDGRTEVWHNPEGQGGDWIDVPEGCLVVREGIE